MTKGEELAEEREIWMKSNPMGRLGQPEELTGAVIMLCSKVAGQYLNGTDVVVDGMYNLFDVDTMTNTTTLQAAKRFCERCRFRYTPHFCWTDYCISHSNMLSCICSSKTSLQIDLTLYYCELQIYTPHCPYQRRPISAFLSTPTSATHCHPLKNRQ